MIISEAAVYVNPEVLYYLQKTTAYSLKKRPLYFSKNSHLLCKIRTAPAEQLHDTILAGRKESRMKKKWISSAAFLYVSAALVMTGCAGGADTATKSVTAASEAAPGPSETISPPGSTAAETGAVPETPPAPPAAPEHGKTGRTASRRSCVKTGSLRRAGDGSAGHCDHSSDHPVRRSR